MREAWRWFGPSDPVTINDVRQTGATDIVSALHHIPAGEAWPLEAIFEHQALIESCEEGQAALIWSVVESIPVHEDVKLGQEGCEVYVDSWIATMENLAACGIKTICYNFMPVIDWTRTDLNYQLPSGGYALRFDQKKFAAFDLCILEREGAEKDYSRQEIEAAKQHFEQMSDDERALLTRNVIAGMPGKMTDAYGLDAFRDMLAKYNGMEADTLRKNLFSFLERVLPEAEKLGVKLAIHPDDPPRDMLGLPRIICTADDLKVLFRQLPSPANGITLCAGTYGSRPDNDLPEMAKQFAPRIHFSHLRGVTRDADEQRSFYEASHLDSDIDMVGVITALVAEERRRRVGGGEYSEIFIRPDHGHQILDDLNKTGNPGYSCIGRLKGLAEIRGVVKALESHYLTG
ncbi:MAG: mannonate dehydratase [Halioglobus sp.]|jgi:mannonate dehydratase